MKQKITNSYIIKDITPKYYKLKKLLLENIQNNVYPPNSRLPSEEELMRKYNITRGTIDRAIHELIREGVIYTIQGKGRFVLPKKQVLEQTNKPFQINNNRIVFIMVSILDEFYGPILKGVMDVLQPEGYNLEIVNSEGKYMNETKLLSKYLKEPISGLIFIPSFSENNYKHLFQLQNRGVTIILIDNRIKGYNFNFVGSDNINGTKDAISYLIKLGHKQIVFLGRLDHNINNSSTIERLEGYKQALLENKIYLNPNLILRDEPQDKKYKNFEERAYIKVKRFLSKNIKFTAIFTANDVLGAYQALKEKNIKVPNDVSIVTFDDSKICKYFEVPLTAVKQDGYHIGYYSAKLLLKKIDSKMNKKNRYNDKPEEIILKTKLIIRKSVKKIN